MTKTSEPIEVPNAIPEDKGFGSVHFAGIYGTTDAKSMVDREMRMERSRKRTNYRECISCDRCTFCIELRGFKNDGSEKLIGFICTRIEQETTAYHTCNDALKNRSGRKRVVFNLENAPLGFTAGMATKGDLPPRTGYEKNGIEPDAPREGYRGGSNFYKRADGDREAVGTGRVPRGLMN
ncbi:MAG: hypothetical protein ACI4CE_07540 [Methanomethylophilus alvi]